MSDFTEDDGYYEYDAEAGDDDDYFDAGVVQDHEADEGGGEFDPAALEAFAQDVQVDIDKLGKRLDRHITGAELETIAKGVLEQLERGETVDPGAALDSFYEQSGTTRPDPGGTMNERAAYYEQRFADIKPATEKDAERMYDLDNARDRQDYMVARMAGDEFEETYE